MLGAALLIGACAAPAVETPAPPAAQSAVEAAAPATPSLYALPGRPALLLLKPATPGSDAIQAAIEGWRPAATPRVRIDGQRVPAQLVRLEGRPMEMRSAWLPPARAWRAQSDREAAGALREGSVGAWALLFDAPSTLRGAARMRVEAHPVTLLPVPPPQWPPALARLPRPDSSVEARRALWEMLGRVAEDATQRWRIRLIGERFTPPPGAIPDLADQGIAALDRQSEALALAGLEVLEELDPELATDVLARLTAVVRTPEGVLLPAWGAGGSEADLFVNLLDPRRSERDKRLDAESFLAQSPRAVAWVIDESSVSSSGHRHVRIGVCDLRGRTTLASCAPRTQAALNTTRLRGHESTVLDVEIPPNQTGSTSELLVRCGDWSSMVRVVHASIPATPPGARLGPFFGEWTLRAWLTDSPPVVRPRWLTAALLQRSPRADGGGDWELFVDCRVEAGVSTQVDTIRVFLGGFDQPAAILRLDRTGAIRDEMRPGSANVIVQIDDRADRWTALLRIPDRFVDGDTPLQIGLERIDGRGMRSTWPRPVLPEARQPGRLRVDLTAWDAGLRSVSR
jgi:hypothetical protein